MINNKKKSVDNKRPKRFAHETISKQKQAEKSLLAAAQNLINDTWKESDSHFYFLLLHISSLITLG